IRVCKDPTDFNIDAGSLTLIGPDLLHQEVSGQSCVVHASSGSTACSAAESETCAASQGSFAADAMVAVLNTCGMSAVVRGFPADGLRHSVEGNLILFGSAARVSAAGGVYRLCWCNLGCRVAEDFRTDFGTVQVLGPTPLEQHRTCISGQTCRVTDVAIHSYLDVTLGEVMILETCSVPSILPRFPSDGVLVSLPAAAGSHFRTFLTDIVSAAGGTYHMCWCGNVPSLCAEPSDFHVNFGTLTIIGPSPLNQQHTCVSGRGCQLNGLPGKLTSFSDDILIADTCSSEDAVVVMRPTGLGSQMNQAGDGSIGVWNSAALTAAGGLYRLCWCSQEAPRCSQASDFATDMGELLLIGGIYRLCWCSGEIGGRPCYAPLDFTTDVGALIVIGVSPVRQDRTCISGVSCTVDGIEGTHISTSDSYLVMDTCGISSTALSGFPGTDVSLQSSGGLISWGVVPITAVGGNYALCWCPGASLVEEMCSTPASFLVEAGRFYVIGPKMLQSRTCISGTECRVEGLLGSFISDADRILVADTCGAMDGQSPTGIVNGGFANQIAAQGSIGVWNSAALTAAGGLYRLCWCSQEAPRCSQASDFATDMGELLLIGPSPLQQDRTCVSGQSCEFDGFLGIHISSRNRILLADTCGESSVPSSMPVATVSAASGYGSVVSFTDSVRVSGGIYRLCWCSGEIDGRPCYAPLDFTTDVGALTVIGVSPVQQDRTCISGVSCAVDGIEGTHMSSSDSYLVMDTCRVDSAVVAGFPMLGAQLDSLTDVVSWGAIRITAPGGNFALCWCPGPTTLGQPDQGNAVVAC
ncbi:agaA33, partial [Symbiodinium microadriaticum]